MRKLAVTLALASTALSTPALARDHAWYVGVEGGAMLVEDIEFDIGTTPRAGRVDHDAGYDVDGVIGYDFGGFRAEAEVGYKRAAVTGYTSGIATPIFSGALLRNLAPGSYDYAGGHSSALSFMVNGLLDFGDENGLSGFVGGGAGIARIDHQLDLNTTGSTIDDSDTVFAWQGLAGVRQAISSSIDVTLKYRFFNADGVKLIDLGGRSLDGRFRSHSLLGGITFNFGGPKEEVVEEVEPTYDTPEEVTPTPPVTPPPPPIIVEKQCVPGPYIVFFDWDKSDIIPEEAAKLDNAISNYAECGQVQVMIAGHADRSGSASYNVGLSQRRADAVRTYLSRGGIPDGVMSTEAFGESKPRVNTADGVREPQNRRVEINYGPGSGY